MKAGRTPSWPNSTEPESSLCVLDQHYRCQQPCGCYCHRPESGRSLSSTEEAAMSGDKWKCWGCGAADPGDCEPDCPAWVEAMGDD